MANQSYSVIEVGQLLVAVTKLKDEGWRLVQIGATRLAEHVELTYSFDRALELTNLRLLVPAPGGRVPSVSSVFWCAFLYENELHDLFGVEVDGMAVDFHGAFYKTAVPFPFSAAPKVKPPSAARPATPSAAAPVAPAAKPESPGPNPSAST